MSKVKRTLLPEDYSGVDPTVLECARLRGVFVDTYFCEWLASSGNVVDLQTVQDMIEQEFPVDGSKHALDTVTRIKRVLDWWASSDFSFKAAQKIVYDERDGIAGTLDLDLDGWILDIKAVSSLQPNYRLQLGAYGLYHPEDKQMGILHVTKDKVRLVEYPRECRIEWKAAVCWYRTLNTLQ